MNYRGPRGERYTESLSVCLSLFLYLYIYVMFWDQIILRGLWRHVYIIIYITVRLGGESKLDAIDLTCCDDQVTPLQCKRPMWVVIDDIFIVLLSAPNLICFQETLCYEW